MRYYRIKNDFKAAQDRLRVIETLERLRKQLDDNVPGKDSENNLLLATWNIRDFGKKNRKGFGPRLKESHYYLAEIISRFDIVAVQEVNEMEEWERLMYLLGPDWDYVATGITDNKLGGNGERLTFVFDRRKVSFQKIIDEIVLPPKLEVGADGSSRGKQFNRTPVKAAFRSGWLKFDLCTVHIYFGADSGAKLVQRQQEIAAISSYLAKEAEEALERGKATFLLGDFNIMHPEHKTMEALKQSGFKIPKTLALHTNIKEDKYYDQIAFMEQKGLLTMVEQESTDPLKQNAGVLDIFAEVMRPKDFSLYKAACSATTGANTVANKKKGLEKYYLDWRTYQMSDHKPMWVRLRTNDSTSYLTNLKEG
jgi:exonuclease III